MLCFVQLLPQLLMLLLLPKTLLLLLPLLLFRLGCQPLPLL